MSHEALSGHTCNLPSFLPAPGNQTPCGARHPPPQTDGGVLRVLSVFIVPGGGGPLARHAVALIRTTITCATLTCLHEQRASLAAHHISPRCCHHHSTTHFDFANPASSQQQPSQPAQHPLLHHLNASAQTEGPRSPPSRPQTTQHAHISQHTTTPSDGSTPSPSPSSSSTSSPEPPAAGPSSLAGVWRDFSLAISRDPAAQRFRKPPSQPGRRHHSSAAITHGVMIRSDSR